MELGLGIQRNLRTSRIFTHDGRFELDARLRSHRWDLVVLTSGFLRNRLREKDLEKARLKFDWIAGTPSVKVALPQDEYECSSVLDDWLCAWKVDVCYTPLPKFSEILYPKFSQLGIIREGFTSYVDQHVFDKTAFLESEVRKCDVFYRTAQLPAHLGSLGQLKSQIGKEFAHQCKRRNLSWSLDVESSEQKLVFGDTWFQRLKDTKFTLATPSGSSILDSDGSIMRCVDGFPSSFSFQELSHKCFLGQDGLHQFQALAPRHLEAALCGAVQIAVPGNYSEVFYADVHYIPLHADFSNFEEVIEKAQDPQYVKTLRKNARETVLNMQEISFARLADEFEELVTERPSRVTGGHQEISDKELQHLQSRSAKREAAYWRRYQPRFTVRRVVKAVGLGFVGRRAARLLNWRF